MNIFDNRRMRLYTLIEQHANGNMAEFAKQLGYSRSQIYQFMSDKYNEGRSMGERAARELERRIGAASGWLDLPPGSVDAILPDRFEGASGTGPELIKPEVPTRSGPEGIPIFGEITINKEGSITDVDSLGQIVEGYLPIIFPNQDLFALQINGIMQQPRMRSGEFIVMDRLAQPYQGDDVLVKFVTGEWAVLQFLYPRHNEYIFALVNDSIPFSSWPERAVVSMQRIVMHIDYVVAGKAP